MEYRQFIHKQIRAEYLQAMPFLLFGCLGLLLTVCFNVLLAGLMLVFGAGLPPEHTTTIALYLVISTAALSWYILICYTTVTWIAKTQRPYVRHLLCHSNLLVNLAFLDSCSLTSVRADAGCTDLEYQLRKLAIFGIAHPAPGTLAESLEGLVLNFNYWCRKARVAAQPIRLTQVWYLILAIVIICVAIIILLCIIQIIGHQYDPSANPFRHWFTAILIAAVQWTNDIFPAGRRIGIRQALLDHLGEPGALDEMGAHALRT